MNKETEKIFSIIAFFAALITAVLSFMNSAFIPSFLLMLSLFIFSICYIIKDTKKILTYILFASGVILIVLSLIYTYMRIL